MDTEHTFYVAFDIDDSGRFESLCAAFEAIKHDKESDNWRSEEDWLAVFNEEALAQFWWPTKEEREAFWEAYWGSPVPERWNVEPPSWDFLSMIDSLKNGEYTLLACRMVDEHSGQIEFDPQSFPFGGTESLQMLVRAFGFEVTDVVDGYPPRTPTQ